MPTTRWPCFTRWTASSCKTGLLDYFRSRLLVHPVSGIYFYERASRRRHHRRSLTAKKQRATRCTNDITAADCLSNEPHRSRLRLIIPIRFLRVFRVESPSNKDARRRSNVVILIRADRVHDISVAGVRKFPEIVKIESSLRVARLTRPPREGYARARARRFSPGFDHN